jgi:transposase
MEPSAAQPSVLNGDSASLLTRLARLEAVQERWEQERQAWTAEKHVLSLRIQLLESQLLARAVAREAGSGDPDALSLFVDEATMDAPVDQAPPADAHGAVAPKTRRTAPDTARRPGRHPLDPALPREVIRLPDPPEASRQDGQRGMPLVPGFQQTLEVLARKPAEYYVKRYERTVWVSPAKTAPVATPWPADVLSRSGVHASIVAHIAAAHFSEHVPYYRLEQQLARTGVSLARSTQVSLMAQLDTLVAPLVDYLRQMVLASGYVHLDATPVDVCDPARPGEARSGHLWAYRARSPDPELERLVWFDYRETKSPVHPAAVLKDYRGVVQTDGASGLNALGPPERITHLGCWAHARRYVLEAVKLGEPRAAGYLTRIDRLFRWDARARRIATATPAIAARVATWRVRFSEPVMQKLFARAIADGLTVPPRSALGVAIGYLLGQRPSLERCVTTPGGYLDNNGAENAIRPLKLGAKNWLFVGHPGAGPRLANLFTLVENCRQAGIDIEAYLIDLVTHLPTHSILRLGDWLPRSWRRARAHGITA